MKKKTTRKLHLPKEIVRELQSIELDDIAGGATNTCDCGSCGNRRSTCPI
jgi:natural product precursor